MSMILNTIYNPPLHEGGVREAVVTRIFATPLRYSEYTADVNPAAVGRNHLRQGDPLLELSNGQIISAPVDGELDWCLPVGSQVTKLTAFGAYMKETGSQSIEVIVKLPSWQPAKPTINQFGWHMAPTAKLSRCFKSVGDQVRKGEPVAAFITEEGEIILVSAPADGKITQECGPASCGAWWRPEDWVVKLRVPLPTP